MSVYGYLRVSSDEQDINSQKQGVVEFAKSRGLKIESYITDEGVSGGKHPSKRKLGTLLSKLNSGDILIASEISRLGRDLYMIMDILHHCMNIGCVVHTVKDNFTLGKDIQSKVLAFAFGLAAEIERQMIQQRTREGLRLRVKMGVLVGRPQKYYTEIKSIKLADKKDDVIYQYEIGVPLGRLAKNFAVSRGTISRALYEWGVNIQGGKWIERAKKNKQEKVRELRELRYKDEEYKPIDIPRDEMKSLIEKDLTIPEIHAKLKNYSYEQIYDTILCDYEYNKLYRKHGQMKLVSRK